MGPLETDPNLLQEQIDYYRARAGEYDQWFLRQGRYDHGPELNQLWFDEVAQVQQALSDFNPAGHVLELACGTGLWTERLLTTAGRITAIDASAEVLAINQARVQSGRVKYVQTNIFDWSPPVQYDAVFFSFWLSHVPADKFADFWAQVARALKPGGRVFFIDSRYDFTSTAKDHRLEGQQATSITRRLNDGREYRIVKIFYPPDELSAQLAQLGWQPVVSETPHYFIYGQAQR